MTSIPGHNLVIQQSGVAQELAHQVASPKPSPEQAAALQEAGEILKNSTVQEFEESEKLKLKKEKELWTQGKNKKRRKKRNGRRSWNRTPMQRESW